VDLSNAEGLDGNNGFLLSPHVDKLFNRGWISFTDGGDLLCASGTVHDVMRAWGLPTGGNVGSFNDRQRVFLEFHRRHVYLGRLAVPRGEDATKGAGDDKGNIRD